MVLHPQCGRRKCLCCRSNSKDKQSSRTSSIDFAPAEPKFPPVFGARVVSLGLSMPYASDIRERPISVHIRGVND